MTRSLWLFLAAFLAGCTATIPLRPLDPTHPASPEAREAPPPRLRALAADDAGFPAAPAGGHHRAE